jgi:uncharacterized protein YqiB (DUF1249 family)
MENLNTYFTEILNNYNEITELLNDNNLTQSSTKYLIGKKEIIITLLKNIIEKSKTSRLKIKYFDLLAERDNIVKNNQQEKLIKINEEIMNISSKI